MTAEVDPALEPCVGVPPLLGAVADIRVALGEAAAGELSSLTDDQVVAAVGQVLAFALELGGVDRLAGRPGGRCSADLPCE